jgi:acyl dehydratase
MSATSESRPLAIPLTDLPRHVGAALGPGDWHLVTQEQVDAFADATGDHQWLHVDPERAASGPFGTTIAHGFLTLSLVPLALKQLWKVNGVSRTVNYGLDRVRFPTPVPVGRRIRARGVIAAVEPIPNGAHCRLELTFEVEEAEKPGCVATVIVRHYAEKTR